MFYVGKNILFQDILPKKRCSGMNLCQFDLRGVENSEAEGLHELLDGRLRPDRIARLVEPWRERRNAEEPRQHPHYASSHAGLGG